MSRNGLSKIENSYVIWGIIFCISCLVVPLPGQTERHAIAEKYKWNLADLYPTSQAWEIHKTSFPEKFAKIASYKGSLALSAQKLYELLNYLDEVDRGYERLSNYASMLSDQDTRASKPLAMVQEVNRLSTSYGESLAFFRPEILDIPGETMDRFFREEPRLEPYRMMLQNIQRQKPHTLNREEEKLLAKTGLISGIAKETHNIFTNADMPFPMVRYADGTAAKIDVSSYEKYRTSGNREDRIKAFTGFFGTLDQYTRTCGQLLYGKIKENLFYRDARNYSSILEMALFGNNIPGTVYTQLIENIHAGLPVLQRYLKLKKRLLKVDELHYYDMYPELVPGAELSFTFEKARTVIQESLKILGKEYGNTLNEAFSKGWIDALPNAGKASGAYCNGIYDVHPYVFVNFNNNYADVSMLAHELGHAVHSCLANKKQPYITAGYSGFLAEVASTVNEALTINHLSKTTKDPMKRLAILGGFLESFRKTLFRQVMFAEYELKINQAAEKGEALTGERFKEMYLDILRRYYGHDQGVAVIDELYGSEWAYISHFFLGFYNYQYSTSFAAAHAIAEKMLEPKTGKVMVEKYLDMLRGGGTDYPIPMLKKIGIDMTKDEPVKLVIKKMESVLDEVEKILAEKK